MKIRAVALPMILVLLLALGDTAPLAYSQPAPPAVIDRALQQQVQKHGSDTARVLIQARHASDAEQAVQHSGGDVRVRLPHIGAISAEVRADVVGVLARARGVVRVALDPPMQPVDKADATGPTSVFAQTVGAPSLWSNGINGDGVAIAVLDSGVQPNEDFGKPARIPFSGKFNQGASSTADQYGHGTWVAGIAAGDGANSDGVYVGVAPQAAIVNLKVSDDNGAAHASDVLRALGWVAKNHATYNIRAVNLSFISSLAEGYATNLLDAAVEMVWHAGVAVVVSAGNRGANTMQYAPANDPYVITVGASDDASTVMRSDDTLAWFSSFGITQDGFSKPDLVAPGRHIVGPLASAGSALAREFPSKVIGRQYIQLSGTSAAAPVVSGSVALLTQLRPDLTPDQVKWLLVHTTGPLASGASGAGAGELDVNAAASVHGAVPRSNVGLVPNKLVMLAYLAATGQSSVSWDSVSWDSVSWDSVSWDSVSWDSVSWDSVSWDSVSWDSVIGND